MSRKTKTKTKYRILKGQAKPHLRLNLRVTDAGRDYLGLPPLPRGAHAWKNPFANPETWPHP